MFKTILVPTDGSNHAERAIVIAADLAAKYDARLIIFHAHMRGDVPPGFSRVAEVEDVVEKQAVLGPEFGNVPASLATLLKDIDRGLLAKQYYEMVGQRILADGKSTAKQNGAKNIDIVAVDGDAAEQIIAQVRKTNIDLIVIGTRGLGDLKGLLVGSVSHKVSQLASCPCLSVK